MGHKFAEIAFTPNVKAVQERQGSRRIYENAEDGENHHDRMGPREADFIHNRDSFYMATVSESGWPYVQHRGGPAGFLRVLDQRTIGFADFRGNRQYLSVGNLQGNDRAALFLMDYANRTRLKILGRATILAADDPIVLENLLTPGYRALVERGILIHVDALDWNCTQHIWPRS